MFSFSGRYTLERYQLPVGFGGFHVSLIDAPEDDQAFVFVYDCGSLQEQHCKTWAARTAACLRHQGLTISAVFLSHTDFDHVCGIDALARGVPIELLVLPLIDLRISLARAASGGRTLPSWYRDFLASPAEWAQARGIRRVVFVEPDEGGPPDDAPPAEIVFENGFSLVAPIRTGSAQGSRLASGSSIGVSAGGQRLLELVPLCLPITSRTAFIGDFFKATRGLDIGDILRGLSTRSRHSVKHRIARIYRSHFGSTNRSSMILLADAIPWHRCWLCTGDANLDSPEVQRLLHPFTAKLQYLDAVHLPHHGSPKNFSVQAATFLDRKSQTRIHWIASSGRNKWKYPHIQVVNAASASGRYSGLWTDSNWSAVLAF